MSERLKLLIYEPDYSGHHLVYLSFLLPAFRHLPVETTILTTPQAIGSDEWSRSIGPHRKWISVDTGCADSRGGGALGSAARRLRDLRRGIARLRPDHVIVMYADGVWQVGAIANLIGRRLAPRHVPVEAWLWRGGFVYEDAPRSAAIKRWLFDRVLRAGLFDAMHIDDDLLLHYAEGRRSARGVRLKLSPNPVKPGELESPEDARLALGLPTEGRLVALLAMIDRRKGADLLLDALLRLREQGRTDLAVVMAGPLHEEIRTLTKASPYRDLIDAGALIVHDRFLSPEEMFRYACACDLMTAPYPNHAGRSSLIIWAAAAGRPTLGAERGCIGHVIRHERLGWVEDPRDAAAFADAMERALEAPWTAEDAQRARRYADRHSLEAFRQQGSAGVRGQLDHPA